VGPLPGQNGFGEFPEQRFGIGREMGLAPFTPWRQTPERFKNRERNAHISGGAFHTQIGRGGNFTFRFGPGIGPGLAQRGKRTRNPHRHKQPANAGPLILCRSCLLQLTGPVSRLNQRPDGQRIGRVQGRCQGRLPPVG